MSLSLEEAKLTSEVITTALPYIQRYKDKLIVVKYGGNAMTDPKLESSFAKDIVLLKTVGIHPVVVHGGGPQVDNLLKELGRESDRIDGMRVTDKATMDEYGIWHLSVEDIMMGFDELNERQGYCQFRDCNHHQNAKGCALWQAVADGHILARRVESFNELIEEVKTGK